MGTFVLLMRGINVGGRNRLPMADLRALVAGLGLSDVATHLQSGNVLCTGTGTAHGVATLVADALRDDLGLDVPVVGRTASAWGTMIGANPLVPLEEDARKLHVTFLAGEPDRRRVSDLMAEVEPFAPDRLVVVGADVFLHCPVSYADTPLQNAFLERRLGQVATTRNWRTVLALADLAGVT
ncbi:MAG: DUF1697 domain-containing protein [Acidimicrobiales bacterium]